MPEKAIHEDTLCVNNNVYAWKIVKESVEIARVYFRQFGFEPEKIEQLIEAGKRDLEKELLTLENLKKEEPLPSEKIDRTLYALQCLLFNMGHNTAADMITAVRIRKDSEKDKPAVLLEQLLR